MKCVLFVTMENQISFCNLFVHFCLYILRSVAYSLPLFGLFSPLRPSFLPVFLKNLDQFTFFLSFPAA